MCNPVLIGVAVAALSVGSAVVEHVGTNQAYAANKQGANLNYANQREVIQQKAVQLDQEKSETAFDTAIATAQAQGSIAASASDQGLGAPSIAQALHADMFGIGRQQSLADLNDSNARAQLANERKGADITRQTTINSKPRSGAAQLGLGVGKGILAGFNAAGSAQKAGG